MGVTSAPIFPMNVPRKFSAWMCGMFLGGDETLGGPGTVFRGRKDMDMDMVGWVI